MKNVLLLIAVFFCSSSFAADMQADTEKEIVHLFEYLENSNCEFNRNGTWYSTYKAVKHIEKKYRYYMKKGLINSAEQFIDRAASRSSMSGKSYLVRCGNSRAVESSTWFTEELKRFRETYQ
jgi:Family of unknown function (DUF5329)